MKKTVMAILLVLFLIGCSSNTVKRDTSYRDEKPELRGVWVASVVNINWPKTVGVGKENIDAQKKEYIKILDEVVKMNMNAVFVQIRPTADTFYPSSYEPWSKYLTGTQGKYPGWDPLKFMIEETHKRGLQFHGWFNPYRITLKVQDKLSANHPGNIHPEWTFNYGGKLYYNPGIPEARDYSIASIMEVVKNYDLDGVHMDDYFYPYPINGEKLPDWKTYLEYGQKNFDVAADWRRNNVDEFVEKLDKEIKAIKPNVQFGISPFGVWRNKDVDPSGSNTRAGVTNYDTLYADTRKWVKKGWIDYIAPQIYWNQGFKVAEYNTLVDWWANEVKGTNTKLYIGHAAYRVENWKKDDELINQIIYNRTKKEVDGSIFFNIDSLINNPKNIKENLIKSVYTKKVEVK